MFGVARIQKVQKSGIRGLEIHNRRLRTSRTNPDIDPARTRLNEDWMPCEHEQDKPLYASLIAEKVAALNLKHKPRSNAVLLLDVVISASPELFQQIDDDMRDRFFNSATRHVAEFFGGKENLIYGHIHRDEKTDHAHIGIVPIVEGRLCAKKLLSPVKLREFQTYMHEKLFRHYGLERGKPASETNRKHKSTLEFKNEQLAKKIVGIDKRLSETDVKIKELEQLEAQLDERQQAVDFLERTIEANEAALLRLEEDLGAKIEKVRAAMRSCDRLQAYADRLHAENAESIEAEAIARPT